jgi:hypothetical protein
MVDFKSLKNNAHKFEQLVASIGDKKDYTQDTRFWYPATDDKGNGMAIIRFLPAPPVDGDDGLPYVKTYNHAFTGPGGKWFIENCPTTMGTGTPCPVCEKNSVLWNTGIKANRDIVSKQKRKLTYISNVWVISDPANPENNNTLRLYKYGSKVFDKIKEAIKPEFEDETSIDPYNFWTGANFRIKIRNVEGYKNYDKSGFDLPEPLFDGDDSRIEALWNKEFSLLEFLDQKNFKSYDEMKKRLNFVLGESGTRPKPPVNKIDDDDNTDDSDLLMGSGGTDNDLDYFTSLLHD